MLNKVFMKREGPEPDQCSLLSPGLKAMRILDPRICGGSVQHGARGQEAEIVRGEAESVRN